MDGTVLDEGPRRVICDGTLRVARHLTTKLPPVNKEVLEDGRLENEWCTGVVLRVEEICVNPSGDVRKQIFLI